MPNYMNLMGEHFSSVECYCDGVPTVYGNITFLGSPIVSQGTLDALSLPQETYRIEASFGSPENSPEDNDILQYNESDNTWYLKTLTEAGIASSSHTHALNDLTDVAVGSPTPATDDVLTYNGSAWQAQQVSGAGICKQIVYGSISKATGTTTIPNDNTLPTSSEGTQIWTANITPGSTTAVIKVSFSLTVDYGGGGMHSDGSDCACSVFRGSTNIGGMAVSIGDEHEQQMCINIVGAPSTTSQVTYSARFGKKKRRNWYLVSK